MSNAVRKKILRTKNLYLCPTNVTSALETKVSAAAAELLSSGIQGSSRNHAERVWVARHPRQRTRSCPLRREQRRRAAPALPGELAHLQGKAGTAHARGAAAAGGSFT